MGGAAQPAAKWPGCCASHAHAACGGMRRTAQCDCFLFKGSFGSGIPFWQGGHTFWLRACKLHLKRGRLVLPREPCQLPVIR